MIAIVINIATISIAIVISSSSIILHDDHKRGETNCDTSKLHEGEAEKRENWRKFSAPTNRPLR
jgi:hypothetical protein